MLEIHIWRSHSIVLNTFRFTETHIGIGSEMKLSSKNTVPLSANSSSCQQPVDATSGLVYQASNCNSRNGLLLKIASCSGGHNAFDMFVSTDIPPTTTNYLYKTTLSKKSNGYFELKLTQNMFQMPPPGSSIQCIIGVRPAVSKYLYDC